MNNNPDLNCYQKLINDALNDCIGECSFGDDTVHRAMKYSLSVGGKRIRPTLVLEACRLCGGDFMKAVDFAVALEMVHTYSLIHDDLPCMDDDELRRGMPSCHVKYGEAFALLAGDGLLTSAFGAVAGSDIARERPAAAIEAVRILSEAAGANGMIGGQVLDLKNENKKADYETVRTLDGLKTGALIRCAVRLGAICADASEEKISVLDKYAENIGFAFQITDDILNVVGDEKLLGKPVGKDAKSGKSTYVSLLGLERASALALELTDKAVAALSLFGDEAEMLKNLAYSLIKRNN